MYVRQPRESRVIQSEQKQRCAQIVRVDRFAGGLVTEVIRSTMSNAFAEWWVRSVKEECMVKTNHHFATL
jgi:hypothetical protein